MRRPRASLHSPRNDDHSPSRGRRQAHRGVSYRTMSATMFLLPASGARIEHSESALRSDDSPATDADTVGVARSRVWRWVVYDVVAWTLVALLFTLQSAASAPGTPFSRGFAVQMAGFIPCMLLTPLIAYVALRFRLSERLDARTIGAHVVTLLVFTVGGGMMMGWLAWLLPW